jgi:hypothetical protein
MTNVFSKDTLSVSFERLKDNRIRLNIDSDFLFSSRKSRLYVNEENLAAEIETLWKSIKTKKLESTVISFEEIDWYDDTMNTYKTPVVRMQRNLKKAHISHQERDSIPKDWGVSLRFVLTDTSTNTPLLEVIKKAIGTHLNADKEEELVKKLKPFLQKKVERAMIEF